MKFFNPIMKFFKREIIDKTNIPVFISELSNLSHKKNKTDLEIKNKEYEYMLGKKNEYFISFYDFMKLLENDGLRDVSNLIDNFRHISELDLSKFSYVDVYPIVEEDKLILALNPDPTYKGNKIRITSVRLTGEK